MQFINFPTILLLAASILSTTALPIEPDVAALDERSLWGVKKPPQNPILLNGIPMPAEPSKNWFRLNGIPLHFRPSTTTPAIKRPVQRPLEKRVVNPFAKKPNTYKLNGIPVPAEKSRWWYLRNGVPLSLRPTTKNFVKPGKRALLSSVLQKIGLKSKPKATPGSPGFVNEQAASKAFAAQRAKKPSGLKKLFSRDGEVGSEGEIIGDQYGSEATENEEEVAESEQTDAPELATRDLDAVQDMLNKGLAAWKSSEEESKKLLENPSASSNATHSGQTITPEPKKILENSNATHSG